MRHLEQHIPQLIDRMAAGCSGPVAIAVSGGSDSLALFLLTAEWAKKSGRELLILTVDHGLRPEAASEAAGIIARADSMGLKSQLLKWTGDSASQAHARRARHSLLAKAAREAGADLLLIGHTADDLEETLLMRLARGSSLVGAAGLQFMSVSPVWPDGRDLLLARPLLSSRRRELQAWLKTRGEIWVNDPSNQSKAYERVRTRQCIAALPEPARLTRIANAASLLRALEDAGIASALNICVQVDPFGLVIYDTEGNTASPRLLAILLQAASGKDAPPERAQLEQLASTLAEGGPGARLTLGGAWLQRQGERLLIGRDPGEAQKTWRGDICDGRYVRSPSRPTLDEGGRVPFLVRDTVPETGYREIISARLEFWANALHENAALTSSEFSSYQTPRLTPVQT